MSTVQEVLATLDQTIKGKQMLLDSIKRQLDPIRQCGDDDMVKELVLETTEKFLVINLIELRNIREHLEKCVA